MKNPLILFLSIIMAAASITAWSESIGDVQIEPTLTLDNTTTLELNGAGVRKKWFFELYVAELYLTKRSSDAQWIINSDEPMAIELNITSDKITNKKMTRALDEGFNNATNGNTKPIAAEISQFREVFSKAIHKGDKFVFSYTPQKGTEVYKNGELIKTIQSLPFKKAVFGIWLGKKPADANLKKALLGMGNK